MRTVRQSKGEKENATVRDSDEGQGRREGDREEGEEGMKT